MKNSLTDIIKKIIRADGKIRIDEYVNICLYHTEYGYYKTSNPIGKKGDFITSPEISQMFGEMIAFWIAHTWHHMGCPQKFNLVEVGAGTGVLAEDILNTLENSVHIYNALTYNIIDISDPLITLQKENLTKYLIHDRNKIKWHDDITDVNTNIPIIFIANEVLDCLASRKFIYTNKGWGEIYITLNKDDEIDVLTVLDHAVEVMIPDDVKNNPMQGDVYEFSPAMINMVDHMATHVNQSKGCGIFIDYGYDKPPLYSTLQSIKKHKHASVLENHGEADITSHVNFKVLSEHLKSININVESLQSQQTFLINLGILDRAELLAGDRVENPTLFEGVESELDRLISIDKMGALFKVLAFSSNKYAGLPAFVSDDPIIGIAHNNCYGMSEHVQLNNINRHKPIQLPPYMKHNIFAPYEKELAHGFFGKNGGVSREDRLKSLNISYSVNDKDEYVAQNRILVMKSLKFTLANNKEIPDPLLYITHQIHEDTVQVIHEDTTMWTRENTPQADAMVTKVPNIILGISTADCGCVLFYDPIAKIIGGAHAGWRGAFANVLENTVAEMEKLGGNRDNIIACMSPCIWQKSYEIDEVFYKNLERLHTNATYLAKASHKTGHYLFDLPKFIENKLALLGIKHIGLSQADTYTDNRFFSHRLDTHNGISIGGRQLSTIMLK